jgi:2-methylisocitrate lyase-like PEP mutase family enzyme
VLIRDRFSLDAKHKAFLTLHKRPGAFVMPNPWDAGSTRIVHALGYEARATTSVGSAFSIGRRDSTAALSRDAILENARAIVEATHLPVSADPEDGFCEASEECAPRTTCGASPTSTARFAVCRPSRRRAHVLNAPNLPDLDAVRTVCAAVSRPVNVVAGLSGQQHTVAELQDAGVKRISVGGSFAQAALGGPARAAQEVLERGTFTYVSEAMSARDAKSPTADAAR